MSELPTILPSLTGEQIAAICERYSTPERPVCAIVASVNGHPVIHLTRAYQVSPIRRQAG